MKPNIHIIGGEEKVSFPTLDINEVIAKVDTGADTSSIWCSQVKRLENGLECIFFGSDSQHFTGKTIFFKNGDFKVSRVHNSFGHNQRRYKVKIPVIISGRRILASFTLSDRSKKTYSVLIGRRLLAKKFLVDVTLAGAKISKKLQKKERVLEQ